MKKLLFTPGPVMMDKKILNIGKKQPYYFRNEVFSKKLLECEKMLLSLANAPKNSKVIFASGSGTLGMEATIVNLLSPKDSTNVINGGGFGKRFLQICKHHDIKTNALQDDLKGFDKKAKTLLVNAHETSNGKVYDLQKIGSFCKKYNTLHIVDAISAFGCDKIDMKAQNIDALIVSSNKALALMPGLVMIILSKNAQQKLVQSKSFYMNFKVYLQDIKRGQTPFTPPISTINQLHKRLKQLQKIGIKKQIKRTKKIALYFRKNIKNLPLSLHVKNMSNGMSALSLTNGEDAREFIKKFENIYNISLTPSGGELGKKLVRIAHMGELRKKHVKHLIRCLNKYFGTKK